MVFFAIWWAWMNFTWFASAYDTDDVPYRLAVFVQIAGALILAAGVPQAFETHRFAIVTLGYTVMRVSLISLWLRAARADATRRTSARRFAAGICLCQAGWIGLAIFQPSWGLLGFAALVLAELLVPIWAEASAPTTWHPDHIAERYGLFTLIVLGESILSALVAIQAAVAGGAASGGLAAIIGGGLLIVLAMWWLYFDQPAADLLTSSRVAFTWGYGHLLIFSSAAAVGAGLAVGVDQATGHSPITAAAAGAAVAVPVAIYIAVHWLLHYRARAPRPFERAMGPATALLVLLTPLTGQAVPLTGLLLAGMLCIKLIRRYAPQAPAAAALRPAPGAEGHE
jgi:low temperature requirement protein LtrA